MARFPFRTVFASVAALAVFSAWACGGDDPGAPPPPTSDAGTGGRDPVLGGGSGGTGGIPDGGGGTGGSSSQCASLLRGPSVFASYLDAGSDAGASDTSERDAGTQLDGGALPGLPPDAGADLRLPRRVRVSIDGAPLLFITVRDVGPGVAVLQLQHLVGQAEGIDLMVSTARPYLELAAQCDEASAALRLDLVLHPTNIEASTSPISAPPGAGGGGGN